ncbi:MAG: DUF4856 domain-containing protein [Reichenbachiella sp.]|uniref:DUF4856 domain-containing protein n=1 Tax=Reichenbachiella sp. TaxID=2184521 RepID=UPI0032634A42
MKISKLYIGLLFTSISLSSCSDDESTISIETPTNYSFSRDGSSTVSFGGQTTRIAMAEELISALTDETKSKESLLSMFAHEEGDSDFSDAELNASSKSVRSKTAASNDFFSNNTTDASAIKTQLDNWIGSQHDEVFPQWEVQAESGTAGQIADGESTRYISANGVEYNQLVGKSLIGALMVDQILNNYLSTAVLDEATNIEDNDAEVVADGEIYTTMEHKWDEAYGYLYGASVDATDPNATLGDDDSFLNKYVAKVDANQYYTGIADDIFDAFKLGRAAIVAKDYTVRDEQAEIIKENLSKVIAVRAVHYLQAGKDAVATQNYGGAFHDLSEALGFVYSLQFTRKPNSEASYFSKNEVDQFIEDILAEENGLWNVSATTLDDISNEIVDAFDLVLAEAVE